MIVDETQPATPPAGARPVDGHVPACQCLECRGRVFAPNPDGGLRCGARQRISALYVMVAREVLS
jgi:hypothetical protein